jgi:GT2 family glycosyltransferase
MNSVLTDSKVLIITVHYKTEAGVLALLRALQNLKGFEETALIVVDNSSGQEHVSALRSVVAQVPNVKLLESDTNRGYFGAARFALDGYLAQAQALPDWVIVCNHDVVIEDTEFFSKLFEHDPSVVGVIAPRITIPLNPIEQNPFMKERPGWWRRFTMRFYSASYPLGVVFDWLSRVKRELRSRISSRIMQPSNSASSRPIYAAHGAFMIFSRRFFEAGGKLDDQLFLFGEEISVAETCRGLGLPVMYEPSLCVVHNEHQSVGHGMSRQMFGYHRQAVRHVLSKYLTS